jgi:hypothetical protein
MRSSPGDTWPRTSAKTTSLPVRVNDARLDALIARGYLAANEREDGLAVQEALQEFLADRLGGHLH